MKGSFVQKSHIKDIKGQIHLKVHDQMPSGEMAHELTGITQRSLLTTTR